MANAVVKGPSGLSLDGLGERIQTLITKGDNNLISAGCHLAEAKEMIQRQDPKKRPYTWKTFCMKFCDKGLRHANRLISYTNGEGDQAKDNETRKQNRKSSQRDAPSRSEPDEDDNEPIPVGTHNSSTPAQRKEFFIFQTSHIIDYAEFDGVPDSEICAAARRVVATWTAFLATLDHAIAA
jgi:hypothetical protein